MSVQQPGPISPGSSGDTSQGQIKRSEWKGHSVTISDDLALPPGLSPLPIPRERSLPRPELKVAPEKEARAPEGATKKRAPLHKPGLVHSGQLRWDVQNSPRPTKPLPPDPPRY